MLLNNVKRNQETVIILRHRVDNATPMQKMTDEKIKNKNVVLTNNVIAGWTTMLHQCCNDHLTLLLIQHKTKQHAVNNIEKVYLKETK